MERYQLQRTLVQLQGENDKLRAKVRKVEEKEDRKRLDDVLDSMESKMRALKLQSKRSKDKKKSWYSVYNGGFMWAAKEQP